MDTKSIGGFSQPSVLVERLLTIALTDRNSFTLFEAASGDKTVIMERCVPRTFEVNGIEVYRDTFPVLQTPEREWPVSW